MRPLLLAIATTLMLAACSSPVTGPRSTVNGFVRSGPTCPVESNPPDPSCAPRPVAGAVIVFQGPIEVEITTAADGSYRVDLPDGDYTAIAQPMERYLGQPAAVRFGVAGVPLTLDDMIYETGILN